MIGSRFGDIFRSNSGKAGLLVAVIDQKIVEELWDYIEEHPAAPITIDLVERQMVAEGFRPIRDRQLHPLAAAGGPGRHRIDPAPCRSDRRRSRQSDRRTSRKPCRQTSPAPARTGIRFRAAVCRSSELETFLTKQPKCATSDCLDWSIFPSVSTAAIPLRGPTHRVRNRT